MAAESPPNQAPAAEELPPTPDPPRHWYGGQTLLADGIGLGLWVTSGVVFALSESDTAAEPIALLGSLTFLFGPAVVHFEHDQVGKGILSIAMRLALPVAGFYVGLAGYDSCGFNDDVCEGVSLSAGLAIAFSPIAIDALIAYAPRRRAVEATPSTTLRPTFTLVGGAPRFGVHGEF